MTEQVSLWQDKPQSGGFAELCSALYERELKVLSQYSQIQVETLQSRLKSLPYYVKLTAHSMMQAQSPLNIDFQNASWSTKQSSQMPLTGQDSDDVVDWYQGNQLLHGLVVPVAKGDHIEIDCIDRVDIEKRRFRTNAYGWFSQENQYGHPNVKLLKPTKRVMMAACAGHVWQGRKKLDPLLPSLRELLLSCTINWKNLKRPTEIDTKA